MVSALNVQPICDFPCISWFPFKKKLEKINILFPDLLLKLVCVFLCWIEKVVLVSTYAEITSKAVNSQETGGKNHIKKNDLGAIKQKCKYFTV